MQAALLYTTRDGARRVRVHNVAVRVAREHAPIFKGLDCDAVVATIARVGAKLVYEGNTLATTTGFLSDMLTTSLATYRSRCCTNPSPSQLILPEAVRLLPVYMLAMLKQPLFRHSAAADARAAAMLQVTHEPVLATLLRLYAKCYSLSAVRAAAAEHDAQRERGQAVRGGRADEDERREREHADDEAERLLVARAQAREHVEPAVRHAAPVRGRARPHEQAHEQQRHEHGRRERARLRAARTAPSPRVGGGVQAAVAVLAAVAHGKAHGRQHHREQHHEHAVQDWLQEVQGKNGQ